MVSVGDGAGLEFHGESVGALTRVVQQPGGGEAVMSSARRVRCRLTALSAHPMQKRE